MSWPALIFLVWGAAAGPAPIHGAAEVLAVNTALQSDVELLKLHRGYVSYLETHPETASLEAAYATLCRTPGFAVVAQSFDEALSQDSASEQAYTKYSTYLASNPNVRSLVEGLNKVDLGSEANSGVLDAALGYLRTNPEQAVSALTSPEALHLVPESLRPLLAKIQADPQTRTMLLDGFQALAQAPGAKENVYPWWQAAAKPNAPVGPRSQALDLYLAGHPNMDAAWHTRTAALAASPNVRAWLRYWHGRVERNAVLARRYWDYLDYMKAHPSEQKQIAAGWEERYGPAAPWPPAGAPPPLAPLRVLSTRQIVDAGVKAKVVHSREFSRPTIQRPTRPARPELRTAPTKPSEPGAEK